MHSGHLPVRQVLPADDHKVVPAHGDKPHLDHRVQHVTKVVALAEVEVRHSVLRHREISPMPSRGCHFMGQKLHSGGAELDNFNQHTVHLYSMQSAYGHAFDATAAVTSPESSAAGTDFVLGDDGMAHTLGRAERNRPLDSALASLAQG